MISALLAGNPNVGKSSLFNALTGSDQHVGNWPGKTVERRAGRCRRGKVELEIVDLPGAYSLTAWSPEEEVARDALVDCSGAVVLAVLDATNVERSLFLATELAELGRPLVLALNMTDVARRAGVTIDVALLAAAFDAPVVSTVARSGQGIDELVAAVAAVAEGSSVGSVAAGVSL